MLADLEYGGMNKYNCKILHEFLNVHRKLYNWSLKLGPKSELKCIVDYMICSVCFCQPWLFIYLMFSMNLLKLSEGIGENLLHK